MTTLNAKIKHFNLNLYYPISTNAVAETNWIIQQTLNNFLDKYGKYESTHTFILEYQDDILSVICYRMLQSLTSVSNIRVNLFGKHKITKKYVKDAKFISKWKLNRLLKRENIIYISTFNPLYQVVKTDKIFKSFNMDNVIMTELINKFCYSHLLTAREFYHIGYIKNDLIEDSRCADFENWCCAGAAENQRFNPKVWQDYELNFVGADYDNDKIYVIKLTSDLKQNNIILQRMENEDAMFFYDIETDKLSLQHQILSQIAQFSLYSQRHSNAPNYYNINLPDNEIQNISKQLGAEIIYIN